MNRHDEQDDPRDAWLREALRHTPDVQAPPASLRKAILHEARHAAASTAVATPAWAGWLKWMLQPPVAVGFAGVMVMTTAGLLWWDEPVPSMARPEPPAIEAPAPAPDHTPKEVPASAVAKPEPAPVARPAPLRERVVPPTQLPRAPAPPPPPAVENDKRMADRRPAATLDEATPPPAAAAPAPRMSTAATQAERADRGVARALAPPSVASVRTDVAARPGQWTWQRGDDPERPADAALLDWLAALDAITPPAGWASGAGERAGTDELVLRRDGRVVHRWVFDDNGVTWLPQGQRLRLESAEVHRLRDALRALP